MNRILRTVSLWLLPVAVLVACSACGKRGNKQQRPDSVAMVDGTPITFEDFERELAFASKTSAGLLPKTDEERMAFRKAVLDDMINRMLVLGAAHEAGVTVAADKVDREILKLKAEYHGSAFNEALAEGSLTQQELRERTRTRLLMERFFVDTVFARVAVTDADVEAWYKVHAEEFAQPEQVRAAQIVVKTLEDARRVQNELRNKGMSFDEAARRFSQSPDAKVGGDLGWFPKGVMPKVFDQQCFSLQPGRVSEIVESEYGFHIFKVLDKRAAEQRPLEKVRGEVEKRLSRHKQEEAQQTALRELRTKAQIVIDEAALAKAQL